MGFNTGWEAVNHICELTAQIVGLTHLIIQQITLLRGAPRFNGPRRRSVDLRRSTGVGGVEADEDFVRGVLQPSVRLVQLPGSLARQLAELVAIGDVRKCTKNQIRTHKVNLLQDLSAGTTWHRRYSYWLDIRSSCSPNSLFSPLDARSGHRVQKLLPTKQCSLGTGSLPLERYRSDCYGELCAWQFQPLEPRNTPCHLWMNLVPELEAEKAEKTRDRALQSSPMDGTHECTTGPISGQQVFCGFGW